MDLDRMLERCRRDQWSVDDLDWSLTPRPMSRADEEAIVQLFTDMAGIELLAAELFAEQERRATDPVLREIFASFVIDERRHAEVAGRLARFYDVHRYRAYRRNESLEQFFGPFMQAVRLLSDEIANGYITGGELILDIALLRSIDDHVADEMSARAMKLINRDESRHIAIDYHMVAFYASEAYQQAARRRPSGGLVETARAWWVFARLLLRAQPFFRDVFFEPMGRVDPSGRRMREAFKRLQLLNSQPGVGGTPFGRFLQILLEVSNHPIGGPLLGRLAARLAGVEPELMRRMYTEAELDHARRVGFEAMAEEALAAKGA